jgi:energy-coupling factor transporter ATP-binding protein EcfA2
MILHGIKAHNFMSLHDCTIDELDDHLNFLVGPNGSGKTTIFRALKAIRDTFSFGKPVPFNQLCTRGVNPQEIDLTLEVEFNTSWEQELITAFLCASLSRPYELPNILSPKLPQRIDPVDAKGFAAFSNWLLHVFRPETLPFLFRGKLHLSYVGQSYENLRITYTFNHESLPMTITIRPADSVLLRGNVPESILGGYSSINGLVDFFQGMNSLQDVVNLLTGQGFPAESSFDPVACLFYLGEKRVMLAIDSSNAQQAYLPAQRRFAELSGNLNLANLSSRSFTFGYVLQLLLKHAFVFTNNLRVPVTDIATYSKEEVAKPEIDLDNEREIPLLLYHLKIGHLSERKRFERIQRSFTELIGEDLGFDIHASFENTQQSELAIDIRVTDPDGEIPLAYHGAGVWEALMLSTILDESEGRVILLDEPASNLHPGRQHKLVKTLHDVPGQVIVVTHSAHMLPTIAEDFYKVRRMQKTRNGTIVKGLESSGPLKSSKIEKELNKSSDLAGLLFADGVILVEGETEIGALNEWFPKSAIGQGKAFSDLNLVLYWVGGKPNLPFHIYFLSEFGVPWVVICDGDALPVDKDRNCQLWEALRDLKRIENIPDTAASFDELKVLAAESGVYTANTSATEKFEDIPGVKEFKNNNYVPGDGKVRQGRYIAARISCPGEVEEILRLALQRLGKHK